MSSIYSSENIKEEENWPYYRGFGYENLTSDPIKLEKTSHQPRFYSGHPLEIQNPKDETSSISFIKSNRKAMNRDWSNQKANSALKAKTGNKKNITNRQNTMKNS